MDELIKKHLQDILTAIEEVEGFFGNAPKVYDDFYSNLCLRRAVERNIEIIGEAMNRILKVDKDIACLLYTSDAADDMQCVDLGGRRILKKKKK